MRNPAATPETAEGPVVAVRDLRAWYRLRLFGVDREVKAVDGITFEVRKDEIYGLAGESSSGKSTLVKTIAGRHAPAARNRWRRDPVQLHGRDDGA